MPDIPKHRRAVSVSVPENRTKGPKRLQKRKAAPRDAAVAQTPETPEDGLAVRTRKPAAKTPDAKPGPKED